MRKTAVNNPRRRTPLGKTAETPYSKVCRASRPHDPCVVWKNRFVCCRVAKPRAGSLSRETTRSGLTRPRAS